MKPKIIGLTGGIGSGKTTVARLFMQKGVPVYIADDEAKIISSDPETVREIVSFFGDGILGANGAIDRAALADMVFSDPEKLASLNSIIHPKVQRHFEEWVSRNAASPFVIKEAAILFESGSYQQCDKVILVTAPQEERIKRVMLRDSTSREQVLQRMERQWNDEQKRQKSDYVIENDNLQTIDIQVLDLIGVLQRL